MAHITGLDGVRPRGDVEDEIPTRLVGRSSYAYPAHFCTYAGPDEGLTRLVSDRTGNLAISGKGRAGDQRQSQ